MKMLLYLYPRAWRRRYGEEFAALLEEPHASLSAIADIVRGAVDAHLHPHLLTPRSSMNHELELSAMRGKRPSQHSCSFCGKTGEQAHRLIAGPGNVAICDACVGLCNEIIAEHEPPTHGATVGSTTQRRRRPVWWRRLLSPRQQLVHPHTH